MRRKLCSIPAMARATGSHFHTFQSLLIRMPIRKTTISSSISAQTLSATMSAMHSTILIFTT